jgi:hypothetical protein
MITEVGFRNALDAAKIQLRIVSDSLGQIATPPLHGLKFTAGEISTGTWMERLAIVPAGHAKSETGADFIYVFDVPNKQRSSIRHLITEVDRARAANIAVSRINPDHTNSSTLYVGRSQKLRSRIAQHLGTDSKTTFALHLGLLTLPPNLTIRLTFMRFDGEDDLLIQAIEDGLWSKRQAEHVYRRG